MNYPLFSSPVDPDLAVEARRHAEWMARHDRQGHDEGLVRSWARRKSECQAAIEAATGARLNVEEICWQSFPSQMHFSDEQLWEAAMNEWRDWSPHNHWEIARVAHGAVGWAMAQSRNSGIWYGCVLVADGPRK